MNPCPITGKIDCQERGCELHYMDAPLRLVAITGPSEITIFRPVEIDDEPDDYPEQPDPTCGASYTTGGFDPYGTSCDLPPHGFDVKHEGPDPFGGDGKVRWLGGGYAAGDPLPYREVEFIR